MSDDLRLNGIVIKTMPVGEYDRLVTILTAEQGKLRAFARGARRPASSLLGITLPFVTGSFSLYQGSSSYTLKGADIKEYFSDLTSDLEGMSYGSYVMEIADYYTVEGSPDRDMMNLVYITLTALRKKLIPVKLIRYIFEIRSMVCQGEFPGVLPELTAGRVLDVASEHAIAHICFAPLRSLYAFDLKGDSLLRLGRAADIYRQKVWERVPNSLAVIESIENSGV